MARTVAFYIATPANPQGSVASPDYMRRLKQLADVVRSPRYATAVGLLLEGQTQTQRGIQSMQGVSFRHVMSRMKEWFQRNF